MGLLRGNRLQCTGDQDHYGRCPGPTTCAVRAEFSWSKLRAAFNSEEGRDAVRKITAGNMAKWTLTANAERDRGLISLYKMEVQYQPPEVAKPLKEVIEAAETFQADRVQQAGQGGD